MSAIAALQQRDVSYFLLGANAVVQPAQPTDAQLQTFMNQHAAQLMRPEMRAISLVRFSAADMAGGVTVSPADIQKEFDFRKDTLSTPETRVIVQIPVKSAADGSAAASRLSRGDDPTAVAKAFGAEPIIYTDKPRSAIADAKIAAAAFAMTQGQVSGPVQGDLGLAAIKVVKVTPAKVATLDSVRAKIESDLKTKAAKNKAYELSQKFDDARQAGASVAAAAQKVGVPVVTIAPFTADGVDAQGKPNPLLLDKIVKSAFTIKAGEESDVQDASSGEYYALKLDKVLPPALPTLPEVRPQLAQAYMREQLVATLKAKADALLDDMRKGEAIDKAAASVGAQVTHQQGMQLMQIEQYKTLGRDFLTGLFGHKAGDVFAGGAPDGVYIARIDAVRAGDVTTTARFLESIRARASQDYLRDLLNDTKSAAAHAVQVNVNLNLARQTMGVDPATIGGAGPKDGGQAK
jgi:peptidyl-prolyl cis-trans isomerase D